jgi:hypothetical protein
MHFVGGDLSLNRWERNCSVLAMTIVAVVAWYFRAAHLDAETAFFGMSPEEFTILKLHPEFFPSNFPGGSPTLGNSIIFDIYPLAYRIGLPINTVWSAVIFCEIVAFMAAGAYAARILIPNNSWLVAAIASMLIAFGPYWKPDLANYSYPFYGWSYCWSFAGFLAAITEIARKRLPLAAVWVVLTFASHAVIGLLTGVFAVAMVAASWRNIKIRSLFVPVLIGAVGCGGWALFIAGQASVSGGGVDPEFFAALHHAQNFHWYPVFQGTFWEQHIRNFLPLLSMLLLLLISLNERFENWSTIDHQLAAGMLAMAATAVVGVLISLATAPPVLIKLAFQRADTNLLLAGCFLIYRRLQRDLAEGKPVERGLAVLIAVAPFQTGLGMPAGPVLMRTAWAIYDGWRRKSLSSITIFAGCFAVFIAVLIFIYWYAGLVPNLTGVRYLGINPIVASIALILTFVFLRPQMSRFAGLAVLTIVTGLSLRAAPNLNLLRDLSLRKDAYALLGAQMWARENTPAGALFMVDPGLQELWRSKSYRPSFGTVREWLFTSVLYNSNADVLEEGMARYRALGLEAPPPIIFDKSERRMLPLYAGIVEPAQRNYYSMTEVQFRRLADDYGIKYFVFQKKKIRDPIPLETVYENSNYSIAKVHSAVMGGKPGVDTR